MSDSVGSVSVEVVPDARGWSEKLRAQIRDTTARIRVEADTANADRELEDTNLLVDHLDGRTANIKVDVDKSALSRTEGVLSGLSSRISGLGLAAGALGPALIPLGAGALGIGAALGGPITAATGGLGAFALVAARMVAETQKAVKAGQQLTPIQKQLVAGWTGLHKAFDKMVNGPAGQSVVKPLIDGMGLLAKILPTVAPLLSSVSHALDGLIRGFSRFTGTDTFKSLTSFFSREAGKALTLFGQAFGNIALGIANIFRALSPSGNKLLEGFVGATAKFADPKAMAPFIGALKRDIPLVTGLVGNLFRIVGNIVTELAPYGEVVLGVIDKITGALSHVKGAAGPLAGGIGLGLFAGPEAGAAVAVVLGLAEAFTKLYQHSKPLRQIIRDIGDYFTSTWLPKIKDAATQVMPALSSAFHDVSKTIRENKGLFETFGKALVAITSGVIISGLGQLVVGIRALGKAFQFGTRGIKFFADVALASWRVLLRGIAIFVQAILSQFGAIVDGAAAAFGWLPGIGGKVKAAQAAFHAFTAHVVGNINAAADRLGALQGQIDAVGKSHPTFKVTAQTLAAVHSLESVRSAINNIHDKTITITALYQRDRAVGPGGGMGHPGTGTKHALGGLISGPGTGTSDSIASWLSNGEYVVNAAATRANRALLDQINSGRRPSYAPRAVAGGGSGMPDRVTLMVDGQQFTAYVRSHADGVYQANRGYERSLGEMSR